MHVNQRWELIFSWVKCLFRFFFFKLAQLHNKIGGNSSFGSANPNFLWAMSLSNLISLFSCRLILGVSEYLSSNVKRKTFKSVDQKALSVFHISQRVEWPNQWDKREVKRCYIASPAHTGQPGGLASQSTWGLSLFWGFSSFLSLSRARNFRGVSLPELWRSLDWMAIRESAWQTVS